LGCFRKSLKKQTYRCHKINRANRFQELVSANNLSYKRSKLGFTHSNSSSSQNLDWIFFNSNLSNFFTNELELEEIPFKTDHKMISLKFSPPKKNDNRNIPFKIPDEILNDNQFYNILTTSIMKTLYSSHLSSGDKLLKIIEDSKINAKTYLSNLNKKQKKKRKKLFRKLIRRKMKRIKKQRHSSSTSQPIPEENCSIDEGESPNSDMSNSSPSLDNQSTLDDELIDEIDNEVFQHLWKKKLRFETNKGASKSMSS